MIHFVTYIDNLNWRVSFYVLEECGEGQEVLEELAQVGCRGIELADASAEIRRCGLNVGLTYSDKNHRNTILMSGLQEDVSEFINTTCHEIHHLVTHICQADEIDLTSEESAYISGEASQVIFDCLRKAKLV